MNRLKSVKDIWNKYKFILTSSQKRWGVVVLILTFLGAVCETVGVSIILPLVQVMIEPQKLLEVPIVSSVIIFLQLNSDSELIWAVGAFVVVVYIIKNVFLLFLSYVRVKYTCKVRRELSIEMMKSYMKRGYVFFLNASTGELIRGMLDGINHTYTALYQIFRLLAEIMTIAVICLYILFSDISMAVCVVLLAFACLLMVVLGFQKWIKKCGQIFYKYSALINKTLLQTFQSMKEILVMGRQEYFVDTYKENYSMWQKGYIGQTVAAESPAYAIEGVCVSGLVIAVCVRAINADDPAALIPQMAAFAVAAFRILPSLGRISTYFNQFMFCVPGINDTYHNFEEVRKVKEDAKLPKHEEGRESSRESRFQEKLSVKGVSWKYPDAGECVLENVSLEIKKGQSVAFVGKSGAGKTTLADIILGLLPPQTGKILIDGMDIADLLKKKGNLIGFVPQSVNLLDDTVRRNVAFGIKDSKIEDERVWSALAQAQLKDVIQNSKNGLDTIIGERGIHFSGGQRQRFAIARALYCNPDILILDEATSALDTETENAVMEAIDALQGHKTLIVIAHRLTTIRNCDVIYEIAGGKAVIRSYEELM